MRYFKTTNASRQYRAGDFVATFEPVENIGGSWIGLLAVDDESAASQLAGANIPQVSEITKEEYEELKKKAPTLARSQKGRPQASSPQLRVVEPAAPVVSTQSVKVENAPVPMVEIRTARLDPPDELRLEAGDRKLNR